MYSESGMLVHGVKLAPKEPDDVLIPRRLESWLGPGWCMTAAAGSEAKVKPKGRHKFWRFVGALTLLWLLWLVNSYPRGGLIHGLLAIAIVVGLFGLFTTWRPIGFATKADRASKRECPPALIDPDDLARFEGEGGLEALGPDRAEVQQPSMAGLEAARGKQTGNGNHERKKRI